MKKIIVAATIALVAVGCSSSTHSTDPPITSGTTSSATSSPARAGIGESLDLGDGSKLVIADLTAGRLDGGEAVLKATVTVTAGSQTTYLPVLELACNGVDPTTGYQSDYDSGAELAAGTTKTAVANLASQDQSRCDTPAYVQVTRLTGKFAKDDSFDGRITLTNDDIAPYNILLP